jgi:predicted amidophosphoribosyltransferase
MCGIEVLRGVLIKDKNVTPQTLLTGGERKTNVAGAFKVKNSPSVKGKTLLLVDDVFTTGATLTECSAVLKNAGAQEVRALTIAQAI